MDVAYKLDCEWPLLARGEVARALPRWQAEQPQLRRFGSAQQLLVFLHSAPAAETDAPLLALLALARCERLAGRTLLQVLLPALKRRVNRIVYPVYKRDEVWEILLYSAWEAICSYPVERRRFRVAANLVLLVIHRATRELHHSPAGSEAADEQKQRTWLVSLGSHRNRPAPPGEEWLSQVVAPPEPIAPEAAVVAAVAAGAISKRDAALILSTRVDGIRLQLIARTFGLSYHALRQRRQRAEQRLRAFLDSSCDVSKRPVLDPVSHTAPVCLPGRERAAGPAVTDVRAGRAA
jgi:DNA-directed RNA polymerase specialized sigma24 family protein